MCKAVANKRIRCVVFSVMFLCGWAAGWAQIRTGHMGVDWDRVERLSGDSLSKCLDGHYFYPTWIEGTSSFHYAVKRNGRKRFYLVDAASGKSREFIRDAHRFVRDYAGITGDTLNPEDMTIYGLEFRDGDTRRFEINRKGKTMVYDIGSERLRESRPKKDRKEGKQIVDRFRKRNVHNPDSTFSMLGCGYDLYVRDNRSGKVTRLTDDGKEGASHTYRNTADTIENSSGAWYGNRFMQVIYDNSSIKEMGFIESLTDGRPKVNVFKMPMPGDEGVRRFRIYWFNPETCEGRYLPIDKYPDQLVEMNFFTSDSIAFFTRRSRKADNIDLCRINIKDGTVTELISEECRPHMNLSLFGYRLIAGGKEILWWSERTGRGNYYLYDSDGNIKNRVTSGDNLVAGGIMKIDTSDRSMIFAGYGNEVGINPYYTYYYKVNLDGSGQRLLTPGDGTHSLEISKDGKWGIDRYSRMDLPTVMQVVDIDNPEKTFVVDSMDVSGLRAAGWKAPELFSVKAADGVTDLYGIMYLPSDFDPKKKYPVITNVYPGPQDDQVTRGFAVDDNGNQSLAEMGFVVINASSRGSSPLRGRDFYTYGYGNLRDYPLADDKHTIEELAKSHSFIDLNRVGIYGHSGGAFQTAAAMMTYPDFYKVGVAASGNHDNNIYIQWWGEVFHGLDEVTDSVTGRTKFRTSIPTNMELAPNLKGRLLLITGDVDKNVPPSCTYRLADALIRSGKRFDMFVLPGKDHGVQCSYYQNMIRYYFADNLLDPTVSHINIINHK